MLEVKSVTCFKQERYLFESLSFSIEPGSIMQIEGPNGSGKTSLLRILAGLSVPDEGEVYFEKQNIDKYHAEFVSKILFIGHKTGVSLQLSAFENICYWLNVHGYESDQDIYELLSKLGLVGLEDVQVKAISAGQQRRVALARLWLNEAKLWILDEPFTALDKQAVIMLQNRFKMHLKEGGAIILSTHQDLSKDFEMLQTLVLEYRL